MLTLPAVISAVAARIPIRIGEHFGALSRGERKDMDRRVGVVVGDRRVDVVLLGRAEYRRVALRVEPLVGPRVPVVPVRAGRRGPGADRAADEAVPFLGVDGRVAHRGVGRQAGRPVDIPREAVVGGADGPLTAGHLVEAPGHPGVGRGVVVRWVGWEGVPLGIVGLVVHVVLAHQHLRGPGVDVRGERSHLTAAVVALQHDLVRMSARDKIAHMLVDFLKQDPTAQPWFMAK